MLPAGDDMKPADSVMKIAAVGRPNTGKSTFINIAGPRRADDRLRADSGTTRDSVDVHFDARQDSVHGDRIRPG